MAKFCGKCGTQVDDTKRFCPKCGTLLDTASGGTGVPPATEPAKTSSNSGLVKILVAIICCLILGGGGFFYYQKTHPANPEPAAAPATAQADNPMDVAEVVEEKGFKVEKVDKYGSIAGNEVLMRSLPSTGAKQLAVLYQGNEVRILGVYECNDPKSAVLDVPSVTISLNNKRINLQGGQAVQIMEEHSDFYRCILTVGDSDIQCDFAKREIRKLYGDIWYKVEKNGQVGYVFGKYVRI